ncbi:MAG: glycosyltransferase family 9 protein [Calditrichaeota bacterium]|nr:glycosyltransferase family 9 protein [Calditrichota bacterium]
MRRILVLHLSRMGDLVQSVPFLTALKADSPEPEVHLLIEKAFAPVAKLLPVRDVVHEISLDEILPPLHELSQMNALDLYRLFDDKVRVWRKERFDEVWNLTHTRPSMVLTYLIGAENGRGVTVDKRGFQLVRSPWLRYFFATNLARPYCQFNLVDIYAQCAGHLSAQREIVLRSEKTAEEYAQTLFLQRGLEPGKPIAMQLGAAHASKRWPAKSFRELAELIRRRLDRQVIVLGHAKEKELAGELCEMPGVTSLIGETTIPQLLSVLRRCAVLVSNDTGTMHLAAGAGVRVLAITLGTALGSETAPYGEGHIVVEPDLPCFPCSYLRLCRTMHCHETVGAEMIFRILQWMLDPRTPLRNISSGVRVYRTATNPQDCMLELVPLAPAEPSLRDELHRIVRPLWRQVLTGAFEVAPQEKPSFSAGNSHLNALAERALPMVRRARAELDTMSSLCRKKPMPTRALWRSTQALSQMDVVLESALEGHAVLRSFWNFAALSKASIEDAALEIQIRETERAYRQLEFLLEGFCNSLGKETSLPKKYESLNRKDICHESLSEWTRA